MISVELALSSRLTLAPPVAPRRAARCIESRVLREEEAVEQRVDAQQPVARQRDPLGRRSSEITRPPRARRRRRGNARSTSTPYCSRKYAGRTEPRLNCRTNSRISRSSCVGRYARPSGSSPRSIAARVGLPRVEVLQVDAVDVAERRHAEADEIGPSHRPIAVDERRRRGILHRGVRAADVIARRAPAPRRLRPPSAVSSPSRRPARRTAPVALQQVPLIVVLNGSSIW